MKTIHHLWCGLSRILLTLLAFAAAPFWVSAVDLDPVQVYSYEPFGSTGISQNVIISGQYAYVANNYYSQGLWVFDITNPASPALVGTYDSTDYHCGLAVSGNYAYLASSSNGVDIVDVSDPTAPRHIASYPPDLNPQYRLFASGVAVWSNYLYVANRYGALCILDVSNPASPAFIGNLSSESSSNSVAVAVNDGRLYYLDGSGRLNILSLLDSGISVPGIPTPIGQCVLGPRASKIAASGNFAYVGDPSQGLYIIDVADPANPKIASTTNVLPNNVTVTGNYAYVGERGFLKIFDVSTPDNPQVMASCFVNNVVEDVAVVSHYAYVADEDGGLRVFDLAPANPQRLGHVQTSGGSFRLAVSGNYAYVADGTNGLEILDVSHSASPRRAANYHTGGFAWAVAVSGDNAYVTDDTNGLHIVNVRDPEHPLRIAECALPGKANSITVSGNYAYLRNYPEGLLILNVSNPANPFLVTNYNATWIFPDCSPPRCNQLPQGLALVDKYAYLADYQSGLTVCDVSDPANPQTVFRQEDSGTLGVWVADHYAYILYEGRLAIYDITNPSCPSYTGRYAYGLYHDEAVSSQTFSVFDQCLYYAGWDGALRVIDVSDPVHPKLIGGNSSARGISGITISSNKVYAVDDSGLAVLNTFSRPPQSLVGMTMQGDHAWYAYFLSNNIVVLDDTNMNNFAQATYSYQRTGASTAALSIDTSSGVWGVTLSFSSPNEGAYTRVDSSQSGTFILQPGSPGPVCSYRPANGLHCRPSQIRFGWSSDDFDRPWFHIYVQRDGQLYCDQWLRQIEWITPDALPPGTYKWWVQAWNPFGKSPWSETFSFTVLLPVPKVLTPIYPCATNVADLTVNYTWSHDTNATWYELCAVKDGRIVLDKWYHLTNSTIDLASGQFRISESPHVEGNYRWWVRGWSPDGTGPWSTNASFTVTNVAPREVVMLAPQGTLNQSLAIGYTWSLDPQATWYELCIVKDAKIIVDRWCSNDELVKSGATAVLPVDMKRSGPGTYSWWVRAWGPGGMGPWGKSLRFTIPAPNL